MGRRQAREAALKALFQVELGGAQPDFALQQTLLEDSLSETDANFARQLVDGVLTSQRELDADLAKISSEWSLQRMANIDRLILRLASFELAYLSEVPVPVAISEAVELAKLYSTAESGRFVNGILSVVAKLKAEKDGKTK
ncbi:MAG: transcription antitermination factor NusB [bacterium]